MTFQSVCQLVEQRLTGSTLFTTNRLLCGWIEIIMLGCKHRFETSQHGRWWVPRVQNRLLSLYVSQKPFNSFINATTTHVVLMKENAAKRGLPSKEFDRRWENSNPPNYPLDYGRSFPNEVYAGLSEYLAPSEKLMNWAISHKFSVSCVILRAFLYLAY